jgi:Cu2+-exporting ATPase
MSCPNCGRHVEHALIVIPGVRDVSVELEAGRASVVHSEDVTQEELVRAVEEEGYRATVAV